ncbi:MAG: hypothetical protein OHK005_13490 [Candidatus Methylacidiphilales bacterium]
MSPIIQAQLEIFESRIAEICRKHRVARLELFGSATGDAFHPDRSDLDFLVTFEQDYFVGIADAYLHLAEELETLFRRPVELLTRRSLRNPYFKQTVNQQAMTIYDSTHAKIPA